MPSACPQTTVSEELSERRCAGPCALLPSRGTVLAILGGQRPKGHNNLGPCCHCRRPPPGPLTKPRPYPAPCRSQCADLQQQSQQPAAMQAQVIGGVSIRAPVPPEYRTVLTPGALEFIAHLSKWVLDATTAARSSDRLLFTVAVPWLAISG